MKIAVVSQYYKPENAKITNSLAEGLAARGHSVRVVTGYPNFPEGKLYKGFRQRVSHRENDGDVEVKRVPLIISHSKNPFGRMANYLSFAVSSLSAGRFVAEADVVYVYATQMTASLAPFLWRRSRGVPFVLHVQDLWPESITESAMVGSGIAGKIIKAVLTPWLTATYRTAAATVAIAPTMGKMLVQRGVPMERLHVVFNWSNDEDWPSSAPVDGTIASGARPGLVVTYAGNIGDLQDLETIVRAAHQVQDLDGFTLALVGSGTAEAGLRELVKELGAHSVEFRGRVEPIQMSDVYSESDFQVVSLKDLEIFRGTIPSKLQSSLAQGIPVITTVAGDVSELVRENGLGFVARPGDVDSVAAAFRAAYGTAEEDRLSMGRRAREFYETHMGAAEGIGAIEKILVDVVTEARRRLEH